MKQAILIFAIVAAFAVKADYIYWMVNNPVNVGQFDNTSKESTWTEARLYLNGSSFDGGTQIGTLGQDEASALSTIGAYAWSDSFSTWDNSSTFFIELYSGEQYLGFTQNTAANLRQYIFNDNSMGTMPANAFGTNGATFAVPEPTSGLLFLLGGMLLGLKRRRMA